MTPKQKPTKFPMRCRTAAGRSKLLEYTRDAVREVVQALVRSQQYWSFATLEYAFEVQAQTSMVLVEIGTETGPRGSFLVKVYVNGRETTMARLSQAIRAAIVSDDLDDDE